MADYTIHQHVLVLCDSPQQINFHITSGDYFAYIATKLGILEEAMVSDNSNLTKEETAILARELRTDLRYVQAHYEIAMRAPEDIQSIPAKGNILQRSA